MTTLTIAERYDRILKELVDVMNAMGASDTLDRRAIKDIDESDLFILEEALRKMVIGQVVRIHVEIETIIDSIIAKYYVRQRQHEASHKYEGFRANVLKNLAFRSKLKILEDILPIPSDIKSIIMAITSARNDLAHNFDPVDFKWTKGSYKKKTLFSGNAMETLLADYIKVYNFFENLEPFG